MKMSISILLSMLILASVFSLPVGAEDEAQSSDEITDPPQPTEVIASEETPNPTLFAESTSMPEPTETTDAIDASPVPTVVAEPTCTPESTTVPETSDSPAPAATAEPTAPISPTAPATASPTQPVTPTEPITPVNQNVQFQIDDSNIYEGMDLAYKDGYVPQVADNTVTLVLPLIANGAILGNQITVTPNLGDTNSSPIQYKNYQKTFHIAENFVNGSAKKTVLSYLVSFDFPLRADRKNGTYPIVLEIQAADENGNQIIQSYNCFITITDAEPEKTDSSNTTPVYSGGYVAPTEAPVSNPRILVSKYIVDSVPVMAGEDFAVTVTLKNTSSEGDVQNLLVTVSCDSTNIVLKNDTSTIFLGDLAAGKTTELELKFGTDREIPAQRYSITLAMEFDDEDAVSMASSGLVSVEVAQPVDVELSPFTMPSEINAGETVQLSFQVMNLGRTEIYNARVELVVPGLSPSGNAFIGNMDPGTSAAEILNVFAGMKEGDERYGYTSGVARLIYEDASGEEYTEETSTTTCINQLVIPTKDPIEAQEKEEKEQTQKAQWWIFVTAGGIAIVALALILGHRKKNSVSPRHIKK